MCVNMAKYGAQTQTAVILCSGRTYNHILWGASIGLALVAIVELQLSSIKRRFVLCNTLFI